MKIVIYKNFNVNLSSAFYGIHRKKLNFAPIHSCRRIGRRRKNQVFMDTFLILFNASLLTRLTDPCSLLYAKKKKQEQIHRENYAFI